MQCLHGKEKTRCRDCGGGSFCEHDIIRGTCSLCEPEQTWRRLKYAAEQRHIRFELTLEQYKTIIQKPCHYCVTYGRPRNIDRWNNFEGYTVNNSRPCCGRCNRWKSDESEDVLYAHARAITEHQQKLKMKSGQSVSAPAMALPVEEQSLIPVEPEEELGHVSQV